MTAQLPIHRNGATAARLLVANRGEIALRIFRTACRMGMQTVAVYSDPDALSPHARGADRAIPLHGNTSAETYMRIDKLLQAARDASADAIHPGYGFLSENAEFAQAVIDAGLTWVGPSPESIRRVGSKSGVKALAHARSVPCLQGYYGLDQSDERLALEAMRIGWPVMVKAAAGGGGRGMRLVTRAEDLLPAVQSARSEALSGFGSGELLLERALLHPRHVEVQIFADTQGHCVHLGERDCSVQRRHQKIIEESPSPAVDAGLRERMGRCATELALAAGYVGAGTVEFLLEGDSFFLMEMNTRLQVEHPVTEMRTGLDLVEWQLRVASGEPLPLTQEQVQFQGHAIEVRLCAEDENFVPHTGKVLHFRAPPLEVAAGGALRLDHAIAQGMQVSSWYDSMLGKLIAQAPTRAQAIDQLAGALDHTELLGLPTNRAFLAACLRSEGFRSGQAVIPFLAEQGEAIRKVLQNKEHATLISCGLAAVLSFNTGAIGDANALPSPFPRPTRLRHRGKLTDCPATTAVQAPVGMVAVRVDSSLWHAQQAGVDFFVEDVSFDPPAGGHAAAAGNALRAPFNGKLVAVHALVGVQVKQGETLMVLESMKLEHSLAAPRDGVVAALHAAPGQQVAPGQVLLELEAIG